MGNFIETVDLGLAVWGQAQVGYSVEGRGVTAYDMAVALAGLQRATAVECGITAYVDLVRARQRKLDELGQALACVADLISRYDPGDDSKTKTTKPIADLAVTICNRYAISSIKKDLTVFEAQQLQQDIQFAMDMEDNNLQQDSSTLQGYVSKRDDAFKLASRLMKKVTGTTKSGIHYVG